MPTFKDDVDCHSSGHCPGSDVYIFETNDDVFECCMCKLPPAGEDFRGTYDEMIDHVEAHAAAGHHVRPSLRKGAPRELTDEWAKLFEETRERQAKLAARNADTSPSSAEPGTGPASR